MVLSRLNHSNIVRYNQAWIEDSKNFQEEDESQEDDFEYNSISSSKSREEGEVNLDKDSVSYNESSLKLAVKESSDTLTSLSVQESLIEFKETSDFNRNKGWEVEDDIAYNEQLKKEKINKTKNLFIQMEYCEGNSLKDAIDKKLLTDDKIKWKIIIQILDALSYVHSKGLIHRDIKPPNIFLDKHFQVKLGDFGLSTVCRSKNAIDNLNKLRGKEFILKGSSDLLSCGVGTKYYISPEQENNEKYDEKTDMYSLGILIFEMFCSFGSLMERDTILRGLREKNFTFPLKFSNYAPKNIVEMVRLLLHKDPTQRPSSYELLNSNLIPLDFNERLIYENFKKIIEENKNAAKNFFDILIDFRIKLKDEDAFNLYQRRSNNYKSFKRSLNNANRSFSNQSLANFNEPKKYISQYWNLYSSGLPINFYVLNETLIKKEIETYLINLGYETVNLIDFEPFDITFQIYDFFENKIKKYDDAFFSKNNLLLASENMVFELPVKIYKKINDFCKIYEIFPSKFLFNFYLPANIENMSNSYKSSNTSINSNIDLEQVKIMTQTWIESNKIINFNSDDEYLTNFIVEVFNLVENLKLSNYNISIHINSTYIIDLIFQKLNIENDIKLQVLYLILRLKTKNFNAKVFTRNLINNHKLFPIDIKKLTVIAQYFENCGEMETLKKNFDKKSEVYLEIERLEDIFKKKEIFNEFLNLRHKIKLDFSLINNNLNHFSGFIFQIQYVDQIDKTILVQGGR